METLRFASSTEFKAWVEKSVIGKEPKYARVPTGRQTWTYGDGHVAETGYGKRGGTLLSNLRYLVQIIAGKLASPKETTIIQEIDSRGGVTLSISWRE